MKLHVAIPKAVERFVEVVVAAALVGALDSADVLLKGPNASQIISDPIVLSLALAVVTAAVAGARAWRASLAVNRAPDPVATSPPESTKTPGT